MAITRGWSAFRRAVEAEIMRHGFPSFEQGHEQSMWDGIPNDLALADHETDDPIAVARAIMWWNDNTVLTSPPGHNEDG